MSTLATIVAVLAAAGAVVSWFVGAVFYLRTLRALSDQPQVRWKAIVAWLFVLKHLKGAAAEHASKVNKAVVAFLVCVLVLAAATSLATNLSRVSG